jgi:hypothetical protein
VSEQIKTTHHITGVQVMEYSTSFESDENPISEGGRWLNGRSDGVDWIDVIVNNGVAYGAVSRNGMSERRAEQGNLDADEESAPEGDYDDPTAVLSGVWGRNQHATGIVFSKNPTEEYFQEVQLRLRHTMRANYCTGYEVFWRCLKSESAYSEIVRWNGAIGDWTSIAREIGPDVGVSSGDVVEATIVGDQIKGYINGVEVISIRDDKIAEGNPGIGFNFGVGHTNVDHGFSAYHVETFD